MRGKAGRHCAVRPLARSQLKGTRCSVEGAEFGVSSLTCDSSTTRLKYSQGQRLVVSCPTAGGGRPQVGTNSDTMAETRDMSVRKGHCSRVWPSCTSTSMVPSDTMPNVTCVQSGLLRVSSVFSCIRLTRQLRAAGCDEDATQVAVQCALSRQ